MSFSEREVSLILAIKKLETENWQLKGVLGYAVPGDIPQNTKFRCGMCDAYKREIETYKQADPGAAKALPAGTKTP